MSRNRSMSMPALRVLGTFAKNPDEEFCGANLIDRLKIPSGTLYPILLRFENSGLLSSDWESGDPAELGRPRRRMYRVTGAGQKALEAELEELDFGRMGLAPEG